MSNLYVADVEDAELVADHVHPQGLPAVLPEASERFEVGVALWRLVDKQRGKRLADLYEPALDADNEDASLSPESMRQAVLLLTELEQAVQRDLTDPQGTLRPEVVERVRAQGAKLLQPVQEHGQAGWSLAKSLAAVARLRTFLAAVLDKGGSVVFE
jgi:hypothetical protein